ncbi:MAG: glycosyltransferase [Magnetococcales bacterium]|nr:glycosyltransferase [Magnetococcales bacterium]
MRILALGNLVFAQELRDLGHEVITCAFGPQMKTGLFGPGVKQGDFGSGSNIHLPSAPVPISQIIKALSPWRPDAVLLGDGSTFPLFPGLELLPVPLLWFAMDSHIHHNWHPDYAAVFDRIVVAQKAFVPNYLRDPDRQKVRWLPLFAHADYDRPLQLERILGLTFVGTLDPALNPERVAFIQALQNRIDVTVITGDYTELYNRSRVVLNQSVAGELNFRTFEAMACGALLLTEKSDNGLEALFKDREELVLYRRGDALDAAAKAQILLENDTLRTRIAASGCQQVHAAHTSRHRAEEIISILKDPALEHAVRKRREDSATIQSHLCRVYDQAARVHRDQNHPSADLYEQFSILARKQVEAS